MNPMSLRPLVIIESPYAGDVERNTLYARRCMHHSIHIGEAPIASHLLYTQPGILDDMLDHERELGIACGLAWSRVCDYHVFYTDLGWSRGMLAAYSFISSLKKPYKLRAFWGPAIEPERASL